MTRHCRPLWLTYRARLGRRDLLEERLFPHLPAVAASIPVAHWVEFKHEALDKAVPFLWFDDSLEPEDQVWLANHKLRDRFIQMPAHGKDNPVEMLEIVRRMITE